MADPSPYNTYGAHAPYPSITPTVLLPMNDLEPLTFEAWLSRIDSGGWELAQLWRGGEPRCWHVHIRSLDLQPSAQAVYFSLGVGETVHLAFLAALDEITRQTVQLTLYASQPAQRAAATARVKLTLEDLGLQP